MQDYFLFDSDDPKQLGVGCDRLGDSTDGLRYDWHWGAWKGCKETPGQCCHAFLPGNVSFMVGDQEHFLGRIKLQVVFWRSEYEAAVGDWISYVVHVERNKPTPPGALLTRVDAQRKAEELLRVFYDGLGKLI